MPSGMRKPEASVLEWLKEPESEGPVNKESESLF